MQNKHAYLIIAHNEPWLLQTLVNLIDDERNDIFITIDSRSDSSLFKDIKAVKSHLTFTKQCDNRWGSVKQIETEYVLFEAAQNSSRYSYYHLLSGQDLPIKSQDYIHDVCDRLQGKEFVGFDKNTEDVLRGIEFKTRYYHILHSHFRCSNIFEKIIIYAIQKSCLLLQKQLGIRRKYPVRLKKGCNWVSITDDFLKYLLERKEKVVKMFNHTFCPDEIFLQTVLWNSPFRDNIFDVENEYHSCLRYIDWNRGKPYTWTGSDFDELMDKSNECFFARKFSSKNKDLILRIVKSLLSDK